MTRWDLIAEHIGAATGEPFQIQRQRPVGGGCINRAAVVEDEGRAFFVKLNAPERLDMFEAESEGLAALAAARAIRVPEPICVGLAGGESFLVMERLDLGGRLDGERAGRQLAELHRATAERFGWHRDNTIGSTPQLNAPHHDWVAFWRDRRLGPQLALAAANGHRGRLQSDGERLLSRLDALIGHAPPPSLLHGVPAVYHGDREADLAMTELFGGFDAGFQAAYREAWPLDPAYAVRRVLYNLYHVLNHLNLFGGGYLQQSRSMIERLLVETA